MKLTLRMTVGVLHDSAYEHNACGYRHITQVSTKACRAYALEHACIKLGLPGVDAGISWRSHQNGL